MNDNKDKVIENIREANQMLFDKLIEQTAELEALRGFSEEVLDNLHRPCRLYLTELAQKWMLFDKHVQPTPLLTGKK